MASSGRKLLSNSIIYTVSGLLLKCFGFFLLPFYTAFLTTEDYGITSIANSFIMTASFIAALSLYSAILRFYIDYKNDKNKLKRFYGTVISFTFLFSFVLLVLSYVFRDYISKKIFSGLNYYPTILVCFISLIFYCQHSIYDNILKSQQKAIKSSILAFLYSVTTVSITMYLVVARKLGANGVILGMMISGAIYTAFFIIDMIVHKEIIFCIDFKILKESLKYSLPIMPHNLSTQIVDFISRSIIGISGSLSSLGIYSVALQFGTIADTIQLYVDQAYGPWLYERLHEKEEGYQRTIRSLVKLLISLIGLFFVVLPLFAHDYIVLFINHSYYDAWKLVPFIVIVYGIKTIYYFYVEVLFYYKEASRVLFVATLTSGIVNVALSYILIPVFGAFGAIASNGISMVIRVVIITFISRKFENIGLCLKDFLMNILIISSFIIIGLSLSFLKYQYQFSFKNLAFKIIIVMAYVALMYFMNRSMFDRLIKMANEKIFVFLNKNKER